MVQDYRSACRTLVLVLSALSLLVASAPARADHHEADGDGADKISVGIITGQNNHAWFKDTPALKLILDDAGLFETTLLVSPDKADPDKAAKWAAFNPAFADYDVVLVNYNDHSGGDAWPDAIKRSFEAYIKGGGKAYIFHAGNNPFVGWTEYEKMVGLLWRGSDYGKRIYFDADGVEKTMNAGTGPGAGHGRRHAYVVDTRDSDHPIFMGLPDRWMHGEDELYHGQRGPAENMTVLLTAYSDAATGGTGVSEPIMWTIPYGDGLVLTNVMGHWWEGQTGVALRCAGFQTVLTRSLEWLVKDKITQPKPEDFPTEDAVSLRAELDIEPLSYIHVPGVPGSDAHADCGCTQPTEPAFVPAWVQYAALLKPLPGEASARH